MREKLLILILFCWIGTIVVGLIINRDSRETVEIYCAKAYNTSVKDYKSCKALDKTQLIKKLTVDLDKGIEVIDLPPIKDLK